MARTRATIHVTVWNDPDFRALPALAKYLYWALLAQPKLSIAGCLDLKELRWAELSPDTTAEHVADLLAVLEDRRYVAIDRETDELVIRTFVRHDVAGNKNSQRGVWTAWQGIESEYLRRVVVANVPDAMWENPEVNAPSDAVLMRQEPLIERVSERPSEQAIELPIPSPVPPPATSTAATLDRAARLLAQAEVDRRGDVSNPDGYIRSRLKDIRRQHDDRWTAMLDANPYATAEDLIAPKPRAVVAVPTVADSTAAATQARYALAEARRNYPCEPCDATGRVELAGSYGDCGACNGSGVDGEALGAVS